MEFWNNFFDLKVLEFENMIIGGDLKLSIGVVKLWGPRAILNKLSDLFSSELKDKMLLHIENEKLTTFLERPPCWGGSSR